MACSNQLGEAFIIRRQISREEQYTGCARADCVLEHCTGHRSLFVAYLNLTQQHDGHAAQHHCFQCMPSTNQMCSRREKQCQSSSVSQVISTLTLLSLTLLSLTLLSLTQLSLTLLSLTLLSLTLLSLTLLSLTLLSLTLLRCIGCSRLPVLRL